MLIELNLVYEIPIHKTSKNFLWTFPNQQLLPKSICVMPEKGINGDISSCFGICSDTPSNWGFNL